MGPPIRRPDFGLGIGDVVLIVCSLKVIQQATIVVVLFEMESNDRVYPFLSFAPFIRLDVVGKFQTVGWPHQEPLSQILAHSRRAYWLPCQAHLQEVYLLVGMTRR